MALKSGRTGVRHDQVNIDGLPISSDFFNALVNDLPTWTDLPSYKNGTEQLLPVNDDEPETSPILCDIQYPDSLRDDQYFTYRKSPTTKDGLAKIRGIRGNTLVWNQLCEHGNFDAVTGWRTNNCTFSVANNEATCIATARNGALFRRVTGTGRANHKVLLMVDLKDSSATETKQLYVTDNTNYTLVEALALTTSYSRYGKVFELPSTVGANLDFGIRDNISSDWVQYNAKNIVFFDLTIMFGLGNEPTIDQFKSLFPLLYYAYNSGSLLSFTGTGIKTVGFNQWDEEWEVGVISSSGESTSVNNCIRSKNYCSCIGGTTLYVRSSKTDGGNNNQYYLAIFFYDGSNSFISRAYTNNKTVVVPNNAMYFKIATNSSTVVYGNTYLNDICVNISSSRNGEYEPYTSNETDLPISTFFPTGMKSAGSVYDELTPTKAITRIGAVDLGTLTWTKSSSGNKYYAQISGVGNVANTKCAMYVYDGIVVDGNYYGDDKTYRMAKYDSVSEIYIHDESYSTVESFKTAMSGVYLFYKLATPVVEATMSFE